MTTPSRELNDLIQNLPAAQSNIDPDVSSKWLMNVHFANGYDTDINEVIEIMESFSPGAEIKIQYLLTNRLMHNDSPSNYILETLWHYLSEGDESRLKSLMGQLEPQLRATDYKVRINQKTNDARHLAVLIAMLDGLGSSDTDYTKQFAKILYRQPDHPEALQGLAMIQRLKGDDFNRVANAYLSEHLAQGHELTTQDPRKLALIQTLFSTPDSLMEYAGMALTNTMNDLPFERVLHKREQYVDNFKAKIDISMEWLKQALNTDTQRTFLDQISQMFYLISDSNWRVSSNHPVITEILEHLYAKLDESSVDWHQSLGKAILRRTPIGPISHIHAAGNAVLRSSKDLVLKMLAHKYLSEFSTDELVEAFATKQKILVEVYKHTGNAELIPHMDTQQKHASISHDLGL